MKLFTRTSSFNHCMIVVIYTLFKIYNHLISGHIYTLHTWGGCMFVSGSQDKTARFWDMRTSTAITVVPNPSGKEKTFLNKCMSVKINFVNDILKQSG